MFMEETIMEKNNVFLKLISHDQCVMFVHHLNFQDLAQR